MQVTDLTPMTSEFEVGDTVTYKPYEKAHKCVVVSVQQGMWGHGKYMGTGEPDERIFYELDNICTFKCTGKCIVESKLFEEG